MPAADGWAVALGVAEAEALAAGAAAGAAAAADFLMRMREVQNSDEYHLLATLRMVWAHGLPSVS